MYSNILHSLKQQIESLNKTDTDKSVSEYITLSTEIKPRLSLYPVTDNNCFFWSKPAQHQTFIGYDSLISIKTQGSDRFVTLKNSYSGLVKQWSGDEQPTAFIVFAFDADDPMHGCWDKLPNTLLTIPKIVIEDKIDIQRISINLNVQQTDTNKLLNKINKILSRFAKDTPCKPRQAIDSENLKPMVKQSMVKSGSSGKNRWLELTQHAISTIKSGTLGKLVTSRKLSVKTEQPVDIKKLLTQLLNYYPTCSIFNYQSQGQTVLAVSPERLLSLNNRHISSDAIGGTISRTPDSLIRFITSDSKLLNEHAIIADDIYRRLDPYCHVLKMPVNPLLMKLHNMYHLETPISGQLREQKNIFDVIDTLHPTPAIAGYPARKAQQWLLQNECYNRGWYTGAFGWIRGIDNGELSVFLRCALIEGNSAQLFAGAGLVAESVAEQEWQETELKMNTILDML
jgi:menaquinone-specific isochorismate synthase